MASDDFANKVLTDPSGPGPGDNHGLCRDHISIWGVSQRTKILIHMPSVIKRSRRDEDINYARGALEGRVCARFGYLGPAEDGDVFRRSQATPTPLIRGFI